MKPLHVLFLLLVTALIFVVAKPDRPMMVRQAEEAAPFRVKQVSTNTYRISLDIIDDDDLPVSDIKWFQKVADFALENRNPWFNVLEQNMGDQEVDGVIELVADPLKGDYDANEILSLQLDAEE